ncbi:hypothetical protein [Streptomyces longisporus]|uniref:Uncharacterized protein n=1 Tax=Streptomyces longisporus TaxID=1948 RepID=A0ABP5YKN0_STRLO
MSIPWQRYAGEPARTVDTMTAAFLVAAFLPGSEIRLPGAHRPDTTGPDPERSLGLIGMRERAQSVGTLPAGRHLEGGF